MQTHSWTLLTQKNPATYYIKTDQLLETSKKTIDKNDAHTCQALGPDERIRYTPAPPPPSSFTLVPLIDV